MATSERAEHYLGRVRAAGRGLRGGGLIVNSVLFSILLVVGTALAVGLVVFQALAAQVENASDRRLIDGAAFFQALLDDQREDLLAAGTWLARDPAFLSAVREERPADIDERLALALRLGAVDEALLADDAGAVITRLQDDAAPVRGGTIGNATGLPVAATSTPSYGIARSDQGFLQQQVVLALPAPDGDGQRRVLRLASNLDQADLDQFRARTGLDISLFYGEARVSTSLRQPSGVPLTSIGADPAILQAVMGSGREVHGWRDLPIGRVRSYYVPLAGPAGAPIGMLAVAIPSSDILGAWQAALLPVLPVTFAITVVGAAIAALLAGRIRTPVLALARAAARLRDGDLATPIPPVREAALAPLAEELERARSSLRTHLQAVAAEEARQRALFAALQEPIIATTSEGQVTRFNPAAAALFGGAAAVAGRPIHALVPFLAAAPDRTLPAPAWLGQITSASGRTLDVEVSQARLAGGHLAASDVYVIHDISRHAELNRLREQLLYDVAHELRAPVAVLENVLEIIAADYGELAVSEFNRLVGTACRTATRLRALMEDLLSAGSIQAGRLIIRPVPTPLAAIVAEAVDAVTTLTAARAQPVQCQLPPDDLVVLADARYARQALANLLINASKYSVDGDTLVVRAEREDDCVRISVEDRGPGIPPAQQADLFQRYYRVTPHNDAPGAGLGLAIVKGIIDAHGGAIGVDSQVGAGTRAWFTLPIVGEPAR